MAAVATKRESESLDLGGGVGGGSVAKKAKTTETEVEMSQPMSWSQYYSPYLEMKYNCWDRAEFVSQCVRLKEYEGFLISKGASYEIINKIMKMRPEDAHSPHEEDVKKALEGFHERGWYYRTCTNDDLEHGYRPGDFTNHHLYRRLCLRDFDLPARTTYEGDRECLSFLKEFEQLVKDFKSNDQSWAEHLDVGWTLTTELGKKYPQVVKEHMVYAFEDVVVSEDWDMISSGLKDLFWNVWELVFDEGLEYSRAVHVAWNENRFYGYFAGRVFQTSSVGALLKHIFEEVSNKINPSSSDEEIEQSFNETLLEHSNKLMQYYPQHIRKKMKIAEQIGII